MPWTKEKMAEFLNMCVREYYHSESMHEVRNIVVYDIDKGKEAHDAIIDLHEEFIERAGEAVGEFISILVDVHLASWFKKSK